MFTALLDLLKFIFQCFSNLQVLCEMKYTSKVQSEAQALGTLHTFDLVTNWLLEAMSPARRSLRTLPPKHLKTNKVTETEARPRQNDKYFTKLTPNDVNRQFPTCHYVPQPSPP